MMRKIFIISLLLICSIFILTACVSTVPSGSPGEADARDESTAYMPSTVVLWNKAALTAIRTVPPRPTVISRFLYMLHTAMYDAWAVCDETAEPVFLDIPQSSLPAERTEAAKREAVSQAAYRILIHHFGEYETNTRAFSTLLDLLGYTPTAGAQSPYDAAEIGWLAAETILESRRYDGSNEENNYKQIVSEVYPELYVPLNRPDSDPGSADFDPNRWQPLRVPTGNIVNADLYPVVDETDADSFEDQQFLTPHWGAVEPFALSSGSQFRPPPPPRLGSPEPFTDSRGITGTSDEIFREQVAEVMEMSANLTDEQKVMAEFWADGPRSETPPGHWNGLAHGISERDAHSIDEDVKLYFALNAALLDAGIAVWDAKRHYDYIRPISAIQYLYSGETIEAWAGPGKGTRPIPAEAWRPYQQADYVTPPFSEYVSGHSTFSAAAAEVFATFTGSDRLFDGKTVLYHTDYNHDGVPDLLGQHIVRINGNLFEESPSEVVILQWETFSEAADEAGMSRLYGGIHFADGDINGRRLGRKVGSQAFEKAQTYWLGEH